MSSQKFDLTLRRHERLLAEYPAEMRVAASSGAVVRLTRSVTGPGGGVLVTTVDFSRGGVGFHAPVYVPRGCSMRVKLVVPGSTPFEFEAPVLVQRVGMVDAKPSYYLGTAFDFSEAALAERVDALIERLKAAGALPEREVRRAS
jgi:hypothetical protein